MKPITLKEFAELAKNDEALKEKLIKSVKPGGGVPQELISLAAEYGYDLTEEQLYKEAKEVEELSAEELTHVAGGFIEKVDLCLALIKAMGGDLEYCYE